MSKDCGRTIAPRIPTKPCDDESGNCRGSSRLLLPSAFSICTLPSTTISTSSAISSPDRPCGSSEPKRQRNGKTSSRQRQVQLRPLPFQANARYRDKAVKPSHAGVLAERRLLRSCPEQARAVRLSLSHHRREHDLPLRKVGLDRLVA